MFRSIGSGLRNLLFLPSHLAAIAKEVQRLHAVPKQIKAIESDLKKIRLNIEELCTGQNMLRKWSGKANRKINALVRAQYLELADNLNARRFQLLSQNEEDGILLALLKESGALGRTFVDIGCGAIGGNSGLLASEFGWAGLMVDASAKSAEKARRNFVHNPKVRVLEAVVTPDNVNDLMRENGFPEPDFFSLDIDSYDYWVFQALESRPKVVALEYNAFFGKEAVTIPYLGIPEDAPKGFHGASLKALTKLARSKGYRLICCENAGVNAFYLRDDIAPDIPGADPDTAYRPQRSRKDPFGVKEVERGVFEELRKKGLNLLQV